MFSTKTGLKHENVLLHINNNGILTQIKKKKTLSSEIGLQWRITERLEDLDFADDIWLFCPNFMIHATDVIGSKKGSTKNWSQYLNYLSRLMGKYFESLSLFLGDFS